MKLQLGTVVRTVNPSSGEAEAEAGAGRRRKQVDLWELKPAGLQSEFQAKQGFTVTLS